MFEDFLSDVEILKNMDKVERSRMADSLTQENFTFDQIVIQEGQQGDKFYMVVEGTCVAKKDKQVVKKYVPGDYFGERALLKDLPRAATIVASTEQLKLVSLDRMAFKRLMGPLEAILARNEQEY